MADMKPLVLLPFALLATSCIPPVPYSEQRPPYGADERYDPYGPGPGRQVQGPETGTYEPVPPYGNAGPPRNPGPPRETAPPPPRIDPYGNPTPDPTPMVTPRPEYPVAKRTANPNEVISPYSPYNVIDVEGFKSGDLAKDPSNKKIFRVP
jgi:hypothetical protein